MKKIIKRILKEEVENPKQKMFLDRVVEELLSKIYVEKQSSGLTSFSHRGELYDLGLFNDELEEIIHDERIFKKMGWDYSVDENDPYDEGYYFKKNNPKATYSYEEFSQEITYEWLDSLVKSGQLGYDENMGEMGEWYIINNDLLIKLKGENFTCPLWRNELHKNYTATNCNNPSNRVAIMKFLDKKYGASSLEMDYVMDKFFNMIPDKLRELGLNIYVRPELKKLDESVVDDFIEFSKTELGLNDDFKVNLSNSEDEVETLANYDLDSGIINVLSKNRAVPDIIKSIAHEMVHHKQNSRGDLRGKEIEGKEGSPWEDEANAKAGELVRKFGYDYPEIYDL